MPGFYKWPLPERAALVAHWADLSAEEQSVLLGLTGLSASGADHMIENVVGVHALPLGVATNFLINGQDYLIPMVIEEPSVVAGCSYAARLAREGGGFTARADAPIMIGQVQVLDLRDLAAAADAVLAVRDELMEAANDCDPTLVKLGGGARDIEVRPIEDSPVGPMLVVHLLFDVRDAMGANAVNTACEKLAPIIERATGGRVSLRILSNLADRRTAWAACNVPAAALQTEGTSGRDVARAIVEAWAFAAADPYRAATHNKGIMNGMDAVCIATGNDWRALEAGAHAYAAREGRYTSLTRWQQTETGDLRGQITLPVAVGIIGGTTRVHPTARVALKILGVESAAELAEVMAAVGLAQNLAAVRALATEGIQRGHMRLHARQLAIAAGAAGDQINAVAKRMVSEGIIRLERAQQIVHELQGTSEAAGGAEP
jgi:hydroxymethylglutaryl-CoA reductase